MLKWLTKPWCQKLSKFSRDRPTDGPTDRPTDRRTDRPTDGPTDRPTWLVLKAPPRSLKRIVVHLYWDKHCKTCSDCCTSNQLVCKFLLYMHEHICKIFQIDFNPVQIDTIYTPLCCLRRAYYIMVVCFFLASARQNGVNHFCKKGLWPASRGWPLQEGVEPHLQIRG